MMITITGASGQLGREIAGALACLISPEAVRLGTRNPENIRDFADRGFQTVRIDFEDPDGMRRAFEDSSELLIICGDAANEVRVLQHRNAIDAAKAAGVGHVFYTSFVNPEPDSLFPFARVHADSEAYLSQSGLSYTFLRNNHYVENIGKALEAARATGVLSLPGAKGKVAYIPRSDIAMATAGALVNTEFRAASYELTGPEALDLMDIARIASDVWGKTIVAREMGVDEFRALLVSRELPKYLIDAQVGIRLASGAGEYSRVGPDAERLAGRPVRSLRDYLMRAAA